MQLPLRRIYVVGTANTIRTKKKTDKHSQALVVDSVTQKVAT